MRRLGADRYDEKKEYIIFPTICHNLISEEASMKLYYYFNNHIFTCYTECGTSYNIFELIDTRFKLCGRNRVSSHEEKKSESDYTFYDIVNFIIDNCDVKVTEEDREYYRSMAEKFMKRKQPTLQPYSENVLAAFSKLYPIEWIEEGISEETMKKFNIRYSISRNCAVIPHYNLDNELIGIRERNFEPDRIEALGKYRPMEVEGVTYKHQLSLALYGLNFSKEGINKIHKVVIAEGEKSVLKSYEYFGDNSIAVAVCGSHLNINQIHLLVKNFDINEIIIAFDKEYTNTQEFIDYCLHIKKMCKKYTSYCDFSFIRDKDNLLDYKDSPMDKGKEVFIKLLEEREKV